MKDKISLIISIIALMLIILGFVGFFRTVAYSASGKQGIFKEELPLGGLNGVVVDSTGNIYCSITSYSRIQVYSPKGQFLYGIGIDAGGGVFNIHIDEKDNLYVASARTNMVYTFNNENLTKEEISNERYMEYKNNYPQKQFIDNKGNIFSVNNSMIFPSIIKTESNGNKYTIVKMGFLSWILMGPLPAWFFAILGIGMMSYVAYRKFRKPFTT